MQNEPVMKIAHAMGSVDGVSYTNSKQAFEASYRAGFRFFEVDVDITSDGKIILFHDYSNISTKTLWLSAKVSSYKWNEIKTFKYCGRYDLLTIDDLIDLLKKYEDIHIILDIKRHGVRVNWLNKFSIKFLKRRGMHAGENFLGAKKAIPYLFGLMGWSNSNYKYNDQYVLDCLITKVESNRSLLDRLIPQVNFENKQYFKGLDFFPNRIWKCVTTLGYEKKTSEASRAGCNFLSTSDLEKIQNICKLAGHNNLNVLVYSVQNREIFSKLCEYGVYGFYLMSL